MLQATPLRPGHGTACDTSGPCMIDLHEAKGAARWVRRAVIATLTAATVLSLVLRLASLAEPLGIDQSLWASAVTGMSRGQLLYRDVWEQRPPGIYWVYLAGFQTLGWTPSTVAWLDILAACIRLCSFSESGGVSQVR